METGTDREQVGEAVKTKQGPHQRGAHVTRVRTLDFCSQCNGEAIKSFD